LLSNDDAAGKDAAITFTPPADGDYVLRIRDLNSKAGRPSFTTSSRLGEAGLRAEVRRRQGDDRPGVADGRGSCS